MLASSRLGVSLTKFVGFFFVELEFPDSGHANRSVGPENIGLHILFVAKGSRGGELPPNHSL